MQRQESEAEAEWRVALKESCKDAGIFLSDAEFPKAVGLVLEEKEVPMVGQLEAWLKAKRIKYRTQINRSQSQPRWRLPVGKGRPGQPTSPNAISNCSSYVTLDSESSEDLPESGSASLEFEPEAKVMDRFEFASELDVQLGGFSWEDLVYLQSTQHVSSGGDGGQPTDGGRGMESSGSPGLAELTVNSGGVVYFAIFQTQHKDSSISCGRTPPHEATAPAGLRAACIKFTSTRLATQAEYLGSEVARYLHIATPQARVVHKSSHEWAAIEIGVAQARWRAQRERDEAGCHTCQEFQEALRLSRCLFLMGYVRGSPLQDSPEAFCCQTAALETARALGGVLALDLVLRNEDRMQCKRLGWRGNASNLLFCRHPLIGWTETGSSAVGGLTASGTRGLSSPSNARLPDGDHRAASAWDGARELRTDRVGCYADAEVTKDRRCKSPPPSAQEPNLSKFDVLPQQYSDKEEPSAGRLDNVTCDETLLERWASSSAPDLAALEQLPAGKHAVYETRPLHLTKSPPPKLARGLQQIFVPVEGTGSLKSNNVVPAPERLNLPGPDRTPDAGRSPEVAAPPSGYLVVIDSGVCRRPPRGKAAMDRDTYPRFVELLLNDSTTAAEILHDISGGVLGVEEASAGSPSASWSIASGQGESDGSALASAGGAGTEQKHSPGVRVEDSAQPALTDAAGSPHGMRPASWEGLTPPGESDGSARLMKAKQEGDSPAGERLEQAPIVEAFQMGFREAVIEVDRLQGVLYTLHFWLDKMLARFLAYVATLGDASANAEKASSPQNVGSKCEGRSSSPSSSSSAGVGPRMEGPSESPALGSQEVAAAPGSARAEKAYVRPGHQPDSRVSSLQSMEPQKAGSPGAAGKGTSEHSATDPKQASSSALHAEGAQGSLEYQLSRVNLHDFTQRDSHIAAVAPPESRGPVLAPPSRPGETDPVLSGTAGQVESLKSKAASPCGSQGLNLPPPRTTEAPVLGGVESDKTSEGQEQWSEEVIKDVAAEVAAEVAELTATGSPLAQPLPSGGSRSEGSAEKHMSPLKLSPPAARLDSQMTMKIRGVRKSAVGDAELRRHLAWWDREMREEGQRICQGRGFSTGFLEATANHSLVDTYELKVRLDHLLERMALILQGAATERPSEVLPHLFIGGVLTARAHGILNLLGVTHVAMLCHGDLLSPAEGDRNQSLKILSCPVEDDDHADIEAIFERVFDFIDSSAAAGGKTLVHCFEGRSRSATVVLSYLIMRRGLTLKEAWKLLKKAHPAAQPNDGFKQLLQQLEVRTRGAISLEWKSRRPETRKCAVCGMPAGLSLESVRVHMRRVHPETAPMQVRDFAEGGRARTLGLTGSHRHRLLRGGSLTSAPLQGIASWEMMAVAGLATLNHQT